MISIFEIFEALNWEEIKKYILIVYKLEIPEDTKTKIIKYFETNKHKEKLINKNNITSAIRKFISRYLSGTRQEFDIKYDSELKLYLFIADLWPKNIEDNENFDTELYEIFHENNIFVENAFDLYNKLEGDFLLNKNINEKIYGKSNIEANEIEVSSNKSESKSDSEEEY